MKSRSAETLLLFREQLCLIAVNPLTRLWLTSGKPGAARISPSGPGLAGSGFLVGWRVCFLLETDKELSQPFKSKPSGRAGEPARPAAHTPTAPSNCLEAEGDAGLLRQRRKALSSKTAFAGELSLHGHGVTKPRPLLSPYLFLPRVGLAKVCLCARRETKPPRTLK